MTKYDKVSGNLGYIDSTHIYENRATKERYTGVTTLIHKFVPEFKSNYWSLYKACKDVMEESGDWYAYKVKAGGWENVVPYYAASKSSMSKSITLSIAKRQQCYLDKWEVEKEEACDLGTSVHLELENALFHSQRIQGEEVNYEVSEEDILALQDFSSNKLYPELLIYNDKYQVAGQADIVKKKGKKIIIGDYKTSKVITKESFRGETLLAPFTHLLNANYYIYQLQMSLYGYMLELLGYEVVGLELYHLYGKNREQNKTYKMKYLKTEAKKILELNKAI